MKTKITSDEGTWNVCFHKLRFKRKENFEINLSLYKHL